MSYLVLARKYRPMFFDDVVGQQHVTLTLQNAIQQKRIANAYLFSGPRGVGKTTVARVLAKALNCEQGPTLKPCNLCSSCVEINESRSLDVFEIDGASNRGIDEVRNLREGLRYSPSPGKYRIYIIDEVHMLTNEAFNALLKTLEEPPPSVLFIFATTEAYKVPATILSRCQRFDFKRMPIKKIMEQLIELCRNENIQIDDEALRLIAVKADGSMRDSQSVLDQIIAYAGATITAKEVSALLGIIDQQLFFQVTDLIQAGDVLGGVNLAGTIFSEGYDFTEFLTGLQEHLRNFLVVATTDSGQEIDASEEHIQRYLSQKNVFTVEDLLRLIKVCSDAENLIRRSANARLHLEVTIVKLIKLNRSIRLSQIIELLDVKKKINLEAGIPSPVTAAAVTLQVIPPPAFKPQPTSPDSDHEPAMEVSPGLTLQDLEGRWQDITDSIKRKKIAIGSILSEGWPIKLDGNRLEIGFSPQHGFHISSIENNRELVQTLLYELLGVRWRIVGMRDETARTLKSKAAVATTDRKNEFERLLKENELVKKIVDTFDTEFIK
jgi:DNA polymerase III subunit gamma/tau